MNRLLYFLLLTFVFLYQSGEAQILDDSTKLIYGPHSTRYVLQEDIYSNSGKYYTADTSIYGFHNYDGLFNGKFNYQNLGAFGTALYSIYPQMPRHIGKSFGFYAYDLYAFDPDKIKYYDTRSPYSSIHYVQGSNGQQYIDALFTANLTPKWNVGFQINKFTSKKLIGQPLSNEKQADHTSFVFFTRYFTKDSTYQLLANASFMDHKVFETGGVVRDTSNSTDNVREFYAYKKQLSFLRFARSFEMRKQIHLFQQLSPFKDPTLQVFHELDYKTQSNRFNDNLLFDSIFYPNRNILLPVDTGYDAITDRTDYTLLENKGGLKGTRGIVFYRAFFKNRLFNYKQFYIPYKRFFYENFLGADVTLALPIKGKVDLLGEYLISRDALTQMRLAGGNKNDYQLRAEYKADYLTIGYHTMNVSPTLLALWYEGNGLAWNNRSKFSTTQINRVYGSAKLEAGKLVVNPGFNFFTFQNLIYYNNLAFPTQHEGTVNYFSADLFLKYNISKIYLENLVKYAQASDIIQVPALYNHARIYYQDKWFKKAIHLQIGFDVFYRQAYYANSYMPITQQFYLNQGPDAFKLPDFFNADFFINLRIKSANGFIKLANFNQPLGPGNMITPYYPVINFNFEFGIKWLFFD